MRSDLQQFAALVGNWASGASEVAEIWFFGSRARGDYHDQSDLDIAVVPAGYDKGKRLANYLFLRDRWQEELAELLPVRVHLKNGDPELDARIVAQAVAREGVLVFRRSADDGRAGKP